MDNFNNIEFHDSDVVFIKKVNDDIVFEVEFAKINDNDVNVSVRCVGVSNIFANGDAVSTIFSVSECGSILDFVYDDGIVVFIVKWEGFNKSVSQTVLYKFSCQSVECTVNSVSQ